MRVAVLALAFWASAGSRRRETHQESKRAAAETTRRSDPVLKVSSHDAFALLLVAGWRPSVRSAVSNGMRSRSSPPCVVRPVLVAIAAEIIVFIARLACVATARSRPLLSQVRSKCMKTFTTLLKGLLAFRWRAPSATMRIARAPRRMILFSRLPHIRLLVFRLLQFFRTLGIARFVKWLCRVTSLLLSVLLSPFFWLVDALGHLLKGIASITRKGLANTLVTLPALAAVVEFFVPGSLSRHALVNALRKIVASMENVAASKKFPLAVCTMMVAATRIAFSHSEGLLRAVEFNKKMVPMAVEYHLYDFLLRFASSEERDHAFTQLHEKYAPRVLADVYRWRGFYLKVGQLISSFGDSFIPSQFVDALRVLQDNVPPQPGSYVRSLVEEELQAPLSTIFSSFELERPLGAASVGQVHAATLRNGLDVVVKVQYPEAETLFRQDITCIKTFCRLFWREQVKIIEEIEKQFLAEFDYRLEASLLREAANNLVPHFPELAIPLPIDAEHPGNLDHMRIGNHSTLCTPRCLVMERLQGKSLLAAQKAQLQKLAISRNTTSEQLRRDLENKIKAGQLNDPLLPSPFFLWLYTRYCVLCDACRNIGNFFMRKPKVYRQPLINVPKLVKLLFDVHGHQLLHDGFFNGDPHPGNIMLLDDGRIGLIDWGQGTRIGREERIKLAKLIIALADRDQVLTAELWSACGFATQHMDMWCLDKWATWRFSRFTPDVFRIFDSVIHFEKKLGGLDPIQQEPQEFVMAFRLAALLRGAAMSLGDLTIDSARKWRRHAIRLLRKEGEPIPRTKRGRRLLVETYLVKTEPMRDLKPLAIKANSVF